MKPCRPPGSGRVPALSPSRRLLPGCPCTWVRRGQFGLRHWPQADNPRAVASSVPQRGSKVPSTANPPRPRRAAHCCGGPNRGTPPRPHSPGARASRAPARAPPAPVQDAYTSGGWAVPAAPTSPRTGRQAQGGPGAGPGLAEGAEDTSEFRQPGRIVYCPLPPTGTQPARLGRPCYLGAQPGPAELDQGLPEASGPPGLGIPMLRPDLAGAFPTTASGTSSERFRVSTAFLSGVFPAGHQAYLPPRSFSGPALRPRQLGPPFPGAVRLQPRCKPLPALAWDGGGRQAASPGAFAMPGPQTPDRRAAG